MSHKLSHTMIRGRTYYTNFRINGSPSYIRISLGTDSFRQAEVMMSRVRPFIPLVQSGAMTVEEFKQRLGGMRELTKDGLDQLLLNVLEINIADADYTSANPRFYSSKKPFSEQADNARKMSEAMRQKMMAIDEAGALELWGLDKEYIVPDELKPVILENTKKMVYYHDLQFQAISALSSGDAPRYDQVMSLLAKEKTRLTNTPSETSSPSPKMPSLSLSKAWDGYVKDKGQKWRRATANENQRFYDVLLYAIGDKPIESITKQDIREALKVAENLPTRNKLPFSKLSLEESINYDVSEEDLISSAHVEKHLKIWRSLFRIYLVETKDLLEKSPTDGISYEVRPNRRGHYSAGELAKLKTKLFSLVDTDWRKWYFLTLIYTGARRGEISSIRKKDIRQNEETGRWYIFIEEGKTDHAQRQIPLNRTLEVGIHSLIAQLKENDLIFNGLPNYTTATDEWISIMKELSIPDYDEFGLKRRIHSLRHTFVSNCLAAGVSTPLLQFVVGHARSQSLGVTSIYTHRPPLKDLLCVVDFQS
ncbi:tyrosine-type recombinase/integrase [Buttiauxella gaviniae]|uniref:Tyrosine-type recombinase/integrase n=1 Tax=Buttiauxella gaviniae TaxID=82990 RepID=A0ABV3P0B0_9ENTR